MFFESHRDKKLYISVRDNTCPPHFHGAVELLYVTDGEKAVVINGKRYLLKEGELCICLPLDVHEYLPSSGCQMCVALPPDYQADFASFAARRALTENVLSAGEISCDIYAHMEKLIQAKDPLYIKGVIGYILGVIAEKCAFIPRANGEKNIIHDILEYIDGHYAEELTLEKVAAHFGYSKYYFSKLFNDRFSMNFSAYINQVRIYKSIPLLKTHKISAVYDECGFHSPQQFYLNFRKVTGMSPKAYLKR